MEIWQYWENLPNSTKPGLIDFCMESVYKNSGCKLNVLTPDNLFHYFDKDEISPNIFKVNHIAQKADYFRLKILYKYGGIWLDADTICFNKIIYTNDNDLEVIFYELDNKIINPIIVAFKKKSKILEKICIEMDKLLDNNYLFDWNELGELLINTVTNNYPENNFNYKIICSKSIYPIPWYESEKFSESLNNNTINNYVVKEQQIIILAFQSLNKKIKDLNRVSFNEEVSKNNVLLFNIINYFDSTKYCCQNPTYLDIWNNTLDLLKNNMKTIKINNIPQYFYKSALIIEPRKHPLLETIIKNTMNHLGNNWGLQIFHGLHNKDFVESLVNNLGINNHVILNNLNVTNLDQYNWDYENLKKSTDFWNKVKGEYCLMFETDTIIRKHSFIEKYFKYNYTGAPWRPHLWGNNKPPDFWVGNSGLSIMKKSVFLETCKKFTDEATKIKQDDIFFHFFVKNLAPYDIAAQFSVESYYNNDPFGMHKPHLYLEKDQINSIMTLDNNFRHDIVLINFYEGKLPDYIKYFIKSCSNLTNLNIQIWIYHTELEDYKSTEYLKFLHITKYDFAKKMHDILPFYYKKSYSIDYIESIIVKDKCNDFKILFGSLFKEELKNFSHWGWIDTDILIGDLSFIHGQLDLYDVVTYPDALLGFVYLSGQLTIIKNTKLLNESWLNPHIIYSYDKKSILNLILTPENQITDEFFSIHYVLWDNSVKFLCDYNQTVSCLSGMHGEIKLDSELLLIKGNLIDSRNNEFNYTDETIITYQDKFVIPFKCLKYTQGTYLTIENNETIQIIDPILPFDDSGFYKFSIFHFHQLKRIINKIKIIVKENLINIKF